MQKFDHMKTYAPTVLRIGVSLVFLWFGFQQLINTEMWTRLIPQAAMDVSGLSAINLVHFNGAFEIVFGLCLLLGFFTRTVAFLLALHMLHITYVVGYNGIGVRDFGLSMAAISTFLYGVSPISLDHYFSRK